MTFIADNTELCSNAALLIILLHNIRLVLTGRFRKCTRHFEGVQWHHHNVTIQMPDSSLTGKQMTINRKRGQGESETLRQRGRKTDRKGEK